MKQEFCIMQDNPPYWRNTRYNSRCHRHEVFYGPNRQRSIKDGLVIFLEPEMHNMSNRGIHYDRKFDIYAKQEAEKKWMEYYQKTVDDFIAEYGKNYL